MSFLFFFNHRTSPHTELFDETKLKNRFKATHKK